MIDASLRNPLASDDAGALDVAEALAPDPDATMRSTLVDLPNMQLIVNYSAGDELIDLPNRHGVHVRQSDVEGFRDAIVAGMSRGALFATTGVTSMNEFVTPVRSLLVALRDPSPTRLCPEVRVDRDGLARRADETVGRATATRDRLGAVIRAWYENTGRNFLRRIPDALNGV